MAAREAALAAILEAVLTIPAAIEAREAAARFMDLFILRDLLIDRFIDRFIIIYYSKKKIIILIDFYNFLFLIPNFLKFSKFIFKHFLLNI